MKLFQKIAAAAEKMSPRKILLLCTLLAIIVFIVIYSTLSSLMGGTEEKKETGPNELVPVIEASVDISPRTVITEDMIKASAVPQNLVPAGALTDKQAVVGKPAAVSILAGDMITERKLNDTSASGFNGLIPKGMRAISFAVNDVTGVAGFAKPGDKVDILLISDKDGTNRIASRTILKDVLLLAVNKTSMAVQPSKEAPKSDDKSVVASSATPTDATASAGTPAVVTVALSPYEAAKLAASAQVGQLQMLLRPFDAANAESDSVSYYVIPMPKQTAPAPSTPPASYPRPTAPAAPAPAVSISSGVSGGISGVEVIRGTNVSRGN